MFTINFVYFFLMYLRFHNFSLYSSVSLTPFPVSLKIHLDQHYTPPFLFFLWKAESPQSLDTFQILFSFLFLLLCQILSRNEPEWIRGSTLPCNIIRIPLILLILILTITIWYYHGPVWPLIYFIYLFFYLYTTPTYQTSTLQYKSHPARLKLGLLWISSSIASI